MPRPDSPSQPLCRRLRGAARVLRLLAISLAGFAVCLAQSGGVPGISAFVADSVDATGADSAAEPAPAPPAQSAPPASAPAPQRLPPGAGGPVSKPKDRAVFFSFGLLAGGQLRDWFQTVENGSTTFDDGSGRFMIGPTLRFNFHRAILEVDALRRGFGARSTGSLLGVGFSTKSTGSSWEFPMLYKRRLNANRTLQFVAGIGGSLRYTMQDASLSATSGGTGSSTSTDRTLTLGIPMAVGAEIRAGHVRISPELRYTLWTADKSLTLVRAPGLFNANANQIGLLFGFTFE